MRQKIWVLGGISLLAFMWLSWFSAQEVYADTIDLTGSCPSRDGDEAAFLAAINTANTNGVPDTLILADRCVYAFGEATDWTYGPSAVVISSTITIEGNGTLFVRHQETANLRYFYVTETGHLTLEEMMFNGGMARGGNGGTGPFSGGGALGAGGVIFNQGEVTALFSTFSYNTAYGGNGGSGGGVNGGGGGGMGGNGAWGTGFGAGGGGNRLPAVNGNPAGGADTGGTGADSGTSGDATGIGGGGGGSQQGDGGDGGWGGGGGSAGYATGAVGGNGGWGGGGGGRGGLPGWGAGASGTAGGGGGLGAGGAIFNDSGAALTIQTSTFAYNQAIGGAGGTTPLGTGGEAGLGLGSAVFNNGGTVHILNSTLAYNLATSGGGAIYHLADGVNTQFTSINSIFSNSTDGQTDCAVSLLNGGSFTPVFTATLIQTNEGCGTPQFTVDPLVNPNFGASGGRVFSLFLLAGSPAIDVGDDGFCPTPDQQNQPRPLDGNGDFIPQCDLGAVEYVIPATPTPTPTITPSPTPTATPPAPGISRLYLPIIRQPSVLLIGEISENGVANRPVGVPGEVFLSQTFMLPNSLPTNGKYYISGRPDALTNVAVDDQIVLLVGGNVIFETSFADEQGEIVPREVEVPVAVLALWAGQELTAELRDVLGHQVGATPLYLVFAAE